MVEEVSPEALHERLEAGDDVQVVDIRPEAEYDRGHVPGALNLPMDRFAAGIEDVEWGEDVVVACPIGKSSVQAARLLGSYEGVADEARVASLDGGYRAWEYDLETGSDANAGTDTDAAAGANTEAGAGTDPDVDGPGDAEENDIDAPF